MRKQIHHKHTNKFNTEALKREIRENMKVLTKTIYSTFGLEEGENVGSMSSPAIQDVQSLLNKVENLSSYYRALTS